MKTKISLLILAIIVLSSVIAPTLSPVGAADRHDSISIVSSSSAHLEPVASDQVYWGSSRTELIHHFQKV